MAIKIPQVQTDDRLINQLQQNVATVLEPIFNNLTGQFMARLTDCSTVPIGTITWQRATATGPVTMTIPSITGTSNSISAYLTGLPTALWPSTTQYMLARILDNGSVSSVGVVIFRTGGVIQLDAGAPFTASGAKGIYATTITYPTG